MKAGGGSGVQGKFVFGYILVSRLTWAIRHFLKHLKNSNHVAFTATVLIFLWYYGGNNVFYVGKHIITPVK